MGCRRLLVFVLPSLCLCSGSASALSGAEQTPIEQLTETADFIGVVECVVAGGVVARYDILETWKGDRRAGTVVDLKMPVDFSTQQYPLALVGDRRLVFAYRDRPERPALNKTSAGGVPLWWRDLPYDFQLPSRQSWIAIEEGATFDDVRDQVQNFLAQGQDDRASALLRATAQKNGFGTSALDRASSHPEVVTALLQTWKTANDSDAERLASILEAVPVATRTVLRDTPSDQFPSAKSKAKLIEAWTATIKKAQTKVPAALRHPSKNELDQMRKIIKAGNDRDPAFFSSVDRMIEWEPETVASWLSTWKEPSSDDVKGQDQVYVVASLFGLRCKQDRARHFTTLLEATSVRVRVAAAVYLAYEDEAKGVEALEVLSKSPGDPGIWASLALARRGSRAALERCTDVFKNNDTLGFTHRNLASRVVELLSNTAANAGLATPVRTVDGHTRARVLFWLSEHSNVLPKDPWLATLKAKKVD